MLTISSINHGLDDKTAKNNNISFVCNAKVKLNSIPFTRETIRYNFNLINNGILLFVRFATANVALYSETKKKKKKKLQKREKKNVTKTKQNKGLPFIAIACKLRSQIVICRYEIRIRNKYLYKNESEFRRALN